MNIISMCVTKKKKLLAPINFLPNVYDQYPRGLLVYLTYTSKHDYGCVINVTMAHVRLFIVILAEDHYLRDKTVFYIVISKRYNWNIGKAGTEKSFNKTIIRQGRIELFSSSEAKKKY